MPAWLDIAMRIGVAIVVVGGIMGLAFRRLPGRNPDKSAYDYSAPEESGSSGSDGGGSGFGH